jgi:hypothetical protein
VEAAGVEGSPIAVDVRERRAASTTTGGPSGTNADERGHAVSHGGLDRGDSSSVALSHGDLVAALADAVIDGDFVRARTLALDLRRLLRRRLTAVP